MGSPEQEIKGKSEESQPCSSTAHYAEDAISQSLPSESRRPKKARGKWVRSNVSIGDMKIGKASQLAQQLTGEPDVDLRLPEWSEISTEWQKCFWVNADDVVFHRVLCLLCQENVLEPLFLTHMKKKHPEESKDVSEVMKRMTTVRLSRFFCKGIVDKEEIEGAFPEEIRPAVEDLLRKGGCVIRKLSDSEKERIRDEDTGRIKKRKDVRPNDSVDLTAKRREEFIKNITLQDAHDIATVLTDDGGTLPEVLFGEEIVPGLRSNRISLHLRRDYCYSCMLNVPSREFERHFTIGNYGYHMKFNNTPEGAFEVMSRMTEVRMCRFFSANPIPLWKIQEVCDNREELLDPLTMFLQERGFAVNTFATDNIGEWPIATRKPCDSADSCGSESDDVYEAGSDCSSIPDSDSSCVSYSSTPASSRASSRSSSPAADGIANISYSVMNRIRLDHRIEHALLDVESMMEVDESYSPLQAEYMFIMGFAMYSLVVSNGSKLNVLNRLLLGDFTCKLQLKNSSLSLIRFKTTSTCQGKMVDQWLVVDETTERAMNLYLMARNRRASLLDCETMMTNPQSSFFVSFFLKGMNGNDVDYPLSQFLRMCGIDWKFRARQFSATVDALIIRDLTKTNADYAFDFFKKLRAKEQNQCEILGSPDQNPLIVDMNVCVKAKTRKNKGIRRGPVGPQQRTVERIMWRIKRKQPEKDRLAKAVKKIKRNYDEMMESSESSNDDVSSESDASTPTHSSPTRPYVATPPPSSPIGYATTPEPDSARSYHSERDITHTDLL